MNVVMIFRRYSLSRSNKAIAALVVALYPKFPNSSTDNRYNNIITLTMYVYNGINCVNGISLNCRYHLQALRHLYVLAAEPRILVTRDVRTDQACSVDVIVRCDDGREGVSSQQTPCVVPEWSTIKEVIYMELAI